MTPQNQAALFYCLLKRWAPSNDGWRVNAHRELRVQGSRLIPNGFLSLAVIFFGVVIGIIIGPEVVPPAFQCRAAPRNQYNGKQHKYGYSDHCDVGWFWIVLVVYMNKSI